MLNPLNFQSHPSPPIELDKDFRGFDFLSRKFRHRCQALRSSTGSRGLSGRRINDDRFSLLCGE